VAQQFQVQSLTESKNTGLELFLDLLFKNGVIEKDEIASLRSRYDSTEAVFEALSRREKISRDKLAEAYANAYDIPYIDLQTIDEKAMGLIDQGIEKRFGFIPFSVDEKNKFLQIAIYDPVRFKLLSSDSLKALEQKLGLKFEFFIASYNQVEKVIKAGRVLKQQPEINLSSIDIPENILRKMPYDLAQKFQAVIFRKIDDKNYDLAAANPDDPKLSEIVDFVQKKGGIKLNVIKADPQQIADVLKKYEMMQNKGTEMDADAPNKSALEKGVEKPDKIFSSQTEPAEVKIDAENPDLYKFLGKERLEVADLKGYANAGQVPQLVASTIALAANERASDIHIEPFEKAIRIRFRIDGELGDVILLPPEMISSIVARIKILSKLKLDEQRIPQDGRFDVKVGKEIIDIRVSTLPTVFGEKVVMRLLSKSKHMEKLEELGFDGLSYDRVVEAINKPYGVILSTGPTGSGKTTTLYSILSRLNRPEVNIVTLEDPVEYELPGINQVQVKPQIGFGFADGLRSVLRQDPNIIMVGEIRDSETAELVTHAALTGHLVLSTLHTNDAAGALPRLYNLGVEPFLLTSAVNAIIGQRLVRRVCQKCRTEINVPQSVLFEVKKELEGLNLNMPIKFFKGKGCSYCRNGFSGRIGIFEVLNMTPEIEDLVLTKKTSKDIFDQAVKSGMITMRQDGFIKAIKGLTTVDEVLRVTSETKEG